MSTPRLKIEDVFKKSGIPTHTFVKPVEYQSLLVSLRTPGRGLVVEGPSGIGKTTSVIKAIEELGLSKKTLRLSARKPEDIEMIREIPVIEKIGLVIVDDFHRLSDELKARLADVLKILADEESESSKLVVVGINKAGDTLIKFAQDLTNRIDTIRFETNPEEKVLELVSKGEKALNISMTIGNDIAREARGSFHIAQMLCHEACIWSDVLESTTECSEIITSMELVRQKVIEGLMPTFLPVARKFATGPRLRREGRAPYLHLLYWLATETEWSLEIDDVLAHHPDQRGSVSQIVDKGYLTEFLAKNEDLSSVIHYDPLTRILNVEDPKFVYFIRNLLWRKFARKVGYQSIDFKSKYDFALSFAGSDREIARKLFEILQDGELEVFYDQQEQHRILAENIEDYLGPIYRSEASFIIALLSKDYPTRIWTKFESDQFKGRFGENAVIPIWFSDTTKGTFDESAKVGGFEINRDLELDPQIRDIADLLVKKIGDHRASIDDVAGESQE